jgi:hypothetical protein
VTPRRPPKGCRVTRRRYNRKPPAGRLGQEARAARRLFERVLDLPFTRPRSLWLDTLIVLEERA